MSFGSRLTYLVGNRDHQVRQQLGLLGGCMCTSHCLSFSMAMGSPGWRTKGFYKWKQSYSGQVTAAERHVPSRRWRCCRCPAGRTPRPGWPVPSRAASSSYSPVECPQPCPLRVRMNDKRTGRQDRDKKRTRIYVFHQDAVGRVRANRILFVCLLFVFSVWQFGNYSVTSKSVSCQGQTFKCQTVFTWRYKFWFYRQQKLIIVIGDVNIINYMRIFFGRHSKNGTKNGRLTFSARVGFWLVGWFVGWCSNSRLLIFDIFCSRGVVIR